MFVVVALHGEKSDPDALVSVEFAERVCDLPTLNLKAHEFIVDATVGPGCMLVFRDVRIETWVVCKALDMALEAWALEAYDGAPGILGVANADDPLPDYPEE
jgi:hypothetical protein